MTNKPKKLIPLLLLLLSLVAHSGLAQSEKPPKWELGTDLLFLFHKSQLPDYSLFATRKLGEKGYALRSRVGFDLYSFRPNQPQRRQIQDEQRYNYMLMIGIENELNAIIGEKTKIYWAFDLIFSQHRTDKQFVSSNDLGDFGSKSEVYKSPRYYINGSLGINQTITRSISLRLESTVSYQYFDYNMNAYWIPLDRYLPIPPKEDLMDQVKGDYVGGEY